MTTTRLALVTGATGAVGPALVRHLLQSGYTVRVYARKAPTAGLFPAEVAYSQGDIADQEALARALKGVDLVFHLAALLHIENPSPEMAALYRTVNVDGTRNVLALSIQAGVKRFIYFSTVKVYGLQQLTPVTEDTAPQPETFYAQTKFQAEQAVLETREIETVVLRLSAVYGPRLRGSWERMVKAIARGWFRPIGALRNRRSLTYVDDVAIAARFVAEHPDTAGRIYNVVGHESVTMHEILTAIYQALGKPMPRLSVPAFLAVSGAFILEKALRLSGKRSPLTVDTIRQIVDDEVYSGERLRQLGMTYTPLNVGWKTTIEAINR